MFTANEFDAIFEQYAEEYIEAGGLPFDQLDEDLDILLEQLAPNLAIEAPMDVDEPDGDGQLLELTTAIRQFIDEPMEVETDDEDDGTSVYLTDDEGSSTDEDSDDNNDDSSTIEENDEAGPEIYKCKCVGYPIFLVCHCEACGPCFLIWRKAIGKKPGDAVCPFNVGPDCKDHHVSKNNMYFFFIF